MPKSGIQIQKQQKYFIAILLSKTLLEKEPTTQIEAKIIVFEQNENFDLYKISRLVNSDFARKTQKSCIFIPTSSNKP